MWGRKLQHTEHLYHPILRVAVEYRPEALDVLFLDAGTIQSCEQLKYARRGLPVYCSNTLFLISRSNSASRLCDSQTLPHNPSSATSTSALPLPASNLIQQLQPPAPDKQPCTTTTPAPAAAAAIPAPSPAAPSSAAPSSAAPNSATPSSALQLHCSAASSSSSPSSAALL